MTAKPPKLVHASRRGYTSIERHETRKRDAAHASAPESGQWSLSGLVSTRPISPQNEAFRVELECPSSIVATDFDCGNILEAHREDKSPLCGVRASCCETTGYSEPLLIKRKRGSNLALVELEVTNLFEERADGVLMRLMGVRQIDEASEDRQALFISQQRSLRVAKNELQVSNPIQSARQVPSQTSV